MLFWYSRTQIMIIVIPFPMKLGISGPRLLTEGVTGCIMISITIFMKKPVPGGGFGEAGKFPRTRMPGKSGKRN